VGIGGGVSIRRGPGVNVRAPRWTGYGRLALSTASPSDMRLCGSGSGVGVAAGVGEAPGQTRPASVSRTEPGAAPVCRPWEASRPAGASRLRLAGAPGPATEDLVMRSPRCGRLGAGCTSKEAISVHVVPGLGRTGSAARSFPAGVIPPREAPPAARAPVRPSHRPWVVRKLARRLSRRGRRGDRHGRLYSRRW